MRWAAVFHGITLALVAAACSTHVCEQDGYDCEIWLEGERLAEVPGVVPDVEHDAGAESPPAEPEFAVPVICWSISDDVLTAHPSFFDALAVAHLRWGIGWTVSDDCSNRIALDPIEESRAAYAHIRYNSQGSLLRINSKPPRPIAYVPSQEQCYQPTSAGGGGGKVVLLQSILVHEMGHLFGLDHGGPRDGTTAMGVPRDPRCADMHPRLDEVLAADFSGQHATVHEEPEGD